MKKLTTLILFLLISTLGFSQYFTEIERNKATFDTIFNTYYFIWRGDTINFDEHASVQFSSDTVN